ncbi:MAG: GNAT family N-acetyltransferase [Dehalococcoidia bacterium]
MSLEVRAAQPEEMRRFVWGDLVAFGSQPTPANIERELEMPLRPEWTLCAVEDGEIASQMGVLPFRMQWNGHTIDVGGVTAVSTLPTHRRRGYLRKLMTKALSDMRDRGQSVAILWASMAAIYQRYGYGLGFRGQRYRFDPRGLSYVEPIATPGRIRFLPIEQAAETLGEVYTRFAGPRTLMLQREPDWWQWQFRWPQDAVQLLAVYEEAGRIQGYVSYYLSQTEIDGPGPRQTVHVSQFVWTTPAAHRALIQYVAGYDLARQVEIRRVPVDDPLVFQVQEPRLYGTLLSDGLWVRLVDVEQALSQRGYDDDGRIRLGIEDELCPWNNGVWEVQANAGTGTVRRQNAEPEIRLSPRALAVLSSGCANATSLAAAGLITADDTAALPRADRLFAVSAAPLCLDGF